MLALTPRAQAPEDRVERYAVEFRRAQIKTFIQENYAKPGLSTEDIADHLEITPRYVQMALAPEGLDADGVSAKYAGCEAARRLLSSICVREPQHHRDRVRVRVYELGAFLDGVQEALRQESAQLPAIRSGVARTPGLLTSERISILVSFRAKKRAKSIPVRTQHRLSAARRRIRAAGELNGEKNREKSPSDLRRSAVLRPVRDRLRAAPPLLTLV